MLRLPSDPRASIYIHDEFANQLPPSDGSIYVNLQSSLQNNDLARADRWRAYLTTDKRRYFRQFSNAHGGILDAFNQLLPMEFLFMGRNAFHIGVFHKLGRLHCDDVCLSLVWMIERLTSTTGVYQLRQRCHIFLVSGEQSRCLCPQHRVYRSTPRTLP